MKIELTYVELALMVELEVAGANFDQPFKGYYHTYTFLDFLRNRIQSVYKLSGDSEMPIQAIYSAYNKLLFGAMGIWEDLGVDAELFMGIGDILAHFNVVTEDFDREFEVLLANTPTNGFGRSIAS